MSSAPYTPPPVKNLRPDELVWLGKVGNDLELALAEIIVRLDSELTDIKARAEAKQHVLDRLTTWFDGGYALKAAHERLPVVLGSDGPIPKIENLAVSGAPVTDFRHVVEVVDVTDEERYFTHGIFLTEQEAREAATCDRPPCGTDSPFTGGVTYEIRKRRVGFHPHEVGEVVLTREWIERGDGPDPGRWTVKDTVPDGKPVSTT